MVFGKGVWLFVDRVVLVWGVVVEVVYEGVYFDK